MKERPILFSGAMVRAILEGRKTQTRRVVKVPDDAHHDSITTRVGVPHKFGFINSLGHLVNLLCPYGQPGDRLWVKETHRFDGMDPKIGRAKKDFESVQFRADGDDEFVRWCPSIFMPRWASRITLEISTVRVERLQDISEADALAEGCNDESSGSYPTCATFMPPEWYQLSEVQQWSKEWEPSSPRMKRWQCRQNFIRLWESINGPGSWAKNPWVWVIEFKQLTP